MQVEGINASVSAAEVVELRATISVMREALGEAEHQRTVAVQQAQAALCRRKLNCARRPVLCVMSSRQHDLNGKLRPKL